MSLTQQSFTEQLLESLNISSVKSSMFLTPYRAGQSIDSVPNVEMSDQECNILRLQYQSLVGSMNWLAHTTWPDISTAVSLLAQHQSLPSISHLQAAKHVAQYLASTKNLGIYFTSRNRSTHEAFLHFPVQA